MEPKEQRKVDDFIIFGVAAAAQALKDADWAPKTYQDQIETGVMIGSGIGGLGGICETALVLHEKGPRRVSRFVPGRLINLISGHVSIMHGLKSGAGRIEGFEASDLACQIAMQVPRRDAPDAFNPDDWMEPKEQRKVDDFIIFGVAAAAQALKDADWASENLPGPDRDRRDDRLRHRRSGRHLRDGAGPA